MSKSEFQSSFRRMTGMTHLPRLNESAERAPRHESASPEWLQDFRKILNNHYGTDTKLEARVVVEANEIANTILDQMGGARKLKLFTGADKFIAYPNGVAFRWPSQQPSRGNMMKITLDPDDTYSVEFMHASKSGAKSVAKMDGVYAEDLMDIFEKQTGLFLTLNKRK